MTRRARTRAAAAAALLLVAGAALAFGQVTGTFAIFNAEVENQSNVLDGGWVPQPSGMSSALDGTPFSQVKLSWTAGAAPPVTGQTIKYASGGAGTNASASCPAAGSGSYGAFSNPAVGVASTDVTGSNIGDWWCFEISASAGTWTTDWETFPAKRIFVAIQTVALGNGGGTANSVENGDTITITYSQNITGPTSLSVEACSASGSILIGASTCSGTPTVGTISGLTIGGNLNFKTSTGNPSANTLTITLGGESNGPPGRQPVSGTGTFTPGTGVTSSGGQSICTATPGCQVSTSSHF